MAMPPPLGPGDLFKFTTRLGLSPYAKPPMNYAPFLPRFVPGANSYWPGEWMPPVDHIHYCRRGYHATTAPHILFWAGDSLFLVEAAGEIIDSEDKICAAEMRFLAPVPAWNTGVILPYALDCAARALPLIWPLEAAAEEARAAAELLTWAHRSLLIASEAENFARFSSLSQATYGIPTFGDPRWSPVLFARRVAEIIFYANRDVDRLPFGHAARDIINLCHHFILPSSLDSQVDFERDRLLWCLGRGLPTISTKVLPEYCVQEPKNDV